ncbi:Os02g0457250 [Oryza sativa Japonica Group]|uniref:Os02g0457250 protein n=1 Tax=Oryza sativa subsp. japonica TaxID=39947 RepID=A0A0P0VIP4_ORYSJ|nr:hypothetical protein EE612_011133 [Oryza sativa]KAF2944668.1 hypothetical protein DAI22_02g159900 [Oryza sativa Japonica Group]BAS78530.1 Os02g0457250 [Oryza sativa Japonica Group]
MFYRRAAASSLEIFPAWTAAARASDSSPSPEPVLLPRVDCRRIPAAGAADSSPSPEPVFLPRVDCRRIPAAGAAASSLPPEPPWPVPTSTPSAGAGA